jgi:hypothetical protein
VLHLQGVTRTHATITLKMWLAVSAALAGRKRARATIILKEGGIADASKTL